MDFKDSKRRASDGRWHIVPAFDEHGQMRLLVTATEGAWIAGTVKEEISRAGNRGRIRTVRSVLGRHSRGNGLYVLEDVINAAKDPVAALARWVAMVKKAQEA
jgi:hypothetical protein